jgi:hypothetical protein
MDDDKFEAFREKFQRERARNRGQATADDPFAGLKEPGAKQSKHRREAKRTAILVRANTLTPESISWSWRNRFAFRKMGVIAGDPGLGKSTILGDIAARHTTGAEFPLGEGKALPCDVLFLTAEDGLRDTLVPRLIAAEADLSRVHFLTGTKIEGAADAMFDIAKDIEVLREVFEDNPEIKVLVIDPITAYLGSGTKAKENAEVRRVLAPLVKLIEDFGISLLVNNHLNKSAGKALYRVLDSIAFVALGRIIHLVAEDSENRDLKKFICSKTNIGSLPRGLTYIIQKVWIDGEPGEQIETTRISWGTQYIDETADEALAAVSDKDPTATDDAIELLRMIFADAKGGPVKVSDIEAEAKAAGFVVPEGGLRQSKPFRKARDQLQIVTIRSGFGRDAVHYWSLPRASPSPSCAPTSAQSSYSTERAHLGKKAAHDDGEHMCAPKTSCAPSPVSNSNSANGGAYDDDDPAWLTAPTGLRSYGDALGPLPDYPSIRQGSSL